MIDRRVSLGCTWMRESMKQKCEEESSIRICLAVCGLQLLWCGRKRWDDLMGKTEDLMMARE